MAIEYTWRFEPFALHDIARVTNRAHAGRGRPNISLGGDVALHSHSPPIFAFLLFLYPILTVYILLFFEALQVQPSVLYLLCVLRAFLIIFLFRHLYSRRFISFSYHAFLLTLRLRSAPSTCQCQRPGSVSRRHLSSGSTLKCTLRLTDFSLLFSIFLFTSDLSLCFSFYSW